MFIIGNKCDLQEQREVTPEMGEKVIHTQRINVSLALVCRCITWIVHFPLIHSLIHHLLSTLLPASVLLAFYACVHTCEDRLVVCCQMAESSYVHGFMETSALDNTNVPHAFHQLAQAMTEINNPKLVRSSYVAFSVGLPRIDLPPVVDIYSYTT